MSLRLVLMRHAKSSWKSEAANDHGRPLNRRGQRDAPRIGAALEARGWWPDVALVSDAARAQQTWALASEGRPEVAVRTEHRLYLAGIAELRAALGALEGGAETALALGHNPGWEEALTWLCGSREPMTTANAALLHADASRWDRALAAPGGFELETILRPKALRD